MNSFLIDLRYAARSVRRSFRITLIVVITLGLAIGLNATIFSGVNSLPFGAVAFGDADSLFTISATDAIRETPTDVSYPEFKYWREQLHSFDAIAALQRMRFGVDVEDIQGAAVSRDFFAVLGVAPALGRTFASEEEQAGNDRVVIVSHRLWERSRVRRCTCPPGRSRWR